jgi:UTP--glucose-1-phosphate uridylyltransferase
MIETKNFPPIRKAVFPVAGLGTRFLPATKVMPKEMLPINDRPLIQHVFEEAREAGIEEFIFVTGRYKEMLVEHFDYQPELIQTLEARNKTDMLKKVQDSEIPEGKLFLTRQARPLGLGHAIWCARKLVGNEPFAILLPDVLMRGQQGCLSQMVDVYNQHGGNVIALEEVPDEETYKYGIIEPGAEKNKAIEVKGLVEKPEKGTAPSNLSVVGRYILQPEVFEYLKAFELGAGNEIQLTDSMAKLIGKQPFNGIVFDGQSYDCGSRLGFIEANLVYGMADADIGDGVREMMKKFINAQDKDHKVMPHAANS